MRRSEIRGHLLDTALRLFNLHGYHATGIDLIIAEAGVAKTTLYRHFETKEDLILAALERRDEEARAEMRTYVEQRTSDPVERLMATFDFLEACVRDSQFRGCIFMSAAGEHKEAADPVFRAALMHKRLVLAYFEELAHAARIAEPKRIADAINLLHEGAVAVAQVTRSAEPVRQSRRMAVTLFDREVRAPLVSSAQRADAQAARP
ncbi:TetR family transcriptional regulator [Ensifer sp. LC499]|uniref:TetR/AcrR family transcriptional regulator n=1 Tax=unclassified Ensifer TaxID=2633371 RepID=UPI0008137D8B|nr:TetR family transcriptional regulator [Ensifer sp. LC499]OCP03038.1 TetR family transcriptional regulator [Ensifer sp. LC14]OCP08170.1 TetR family transcriptional regulator [Ensifer sp. LC11]OCP08843.1 TetR family transcriptional regulator [Ensifer sp. LC13]OCP32212.1 TetR family transcriptional regulator [Ensifer sp. LC499]